MDSDKSDKGRTCRSCRMNHLQFCRSWGLLPLAFVALGFVAHRSTRSIGIGLDVGLVRITSLRWRCRTPGLNGGSAAGRALKYMPPVISGARRNELAEVVINRVLFLVPGTGLTYGYVGKFTKQHKTHTGLTSYSLEL